MLVFRAIRRQFRPNFLPMAAIICLIVVTSRQAVFAESFDEQAYTSRVQPLLKQYCLGCHSTEKHKGDLDLERFGSIAQARKDVKPWIAVAEMVEAGEMPPKKKPQPTDEERGRLLAWVGQFLDGEALAHAGDPGPVPLRRLSNAEYNYTIRDLTGVDLQPAREFPADGAAGEGFTNAAGALSDISPTLLNKYLLSAKEIASHAVLLPDGFRFSPGKTSRDWTNESLAKLRAFYAHFTGDGKLPLAPYLASTIRNRDALLAGKITLDEIADREKLNRKYLGVLWQTLSDQNKSFPMEAIRAHWRTASEKDAGAIAAEITDVQSQVWSQIPIGSYRFGNLVRQHASNALIADSQIVRLAFKPDAGQTDVTLYLSARQIIGSEKGGVVLWSRPRFEAEKKPELLLRDYEKFGHGYEINNTVVFAHSAKYLAAVAALANDPQLTAQEIAKQDGLDAAFLNRWISLIAFPAASDRRAEPESAERQVAALALLPLDEKKPVGTNPAIKGWESKGIDLPSVMSNSSDKEEHIPGRASPHKVIVHPSPEEFAGVVWKSPIEGKVHVAAKIVHAHGACGNGVAWWLEHRRADHAGVLSEGAIAQGGEAQSPPALVKVEKGDLLLLALDAKDHDHSCDLSELTLTITEAAKDGRTWDLAADVADTIQAGNPHADRLGNADVWHFVKGPTRPVNAGKSVALEIPINSALSHWRDAALDATRQEETAKLAAQVQSLLSGPRPGNDHAADQAMYDRLALPESALLAGLDLTPLDAGHSPDKHFGLDAARFGVDPAGKSVDAASLAAEADSVIEIHLPAALLRDRTFVVEGKLADGGESRAVQFQVLTSPPKSEAGQPVKGPLVAVQNGPAYKHLAAGLDEFRNCFPLYICFPNIIPVDEVVCLKMYHREDEPLERLFLSDLQKAQIDRLWEEHTFITQWPIAENKYLPLFIGFVTQDQSKEMLSFYEGQREPFKKRSDAFAAEIEAAVPKQLDALAEFASRAYRRPLRDSERADMGVLYQALRGKGASPQEAVRDVMARVFISSSFLFKLEDAPAGINAGPVNDWQLATRLSYFLWASVPDESLRKAAAEGRLHDPAVLAEQANRMLKDDRVRAMAIEFGTQWLHVRGFDEFQEKSEKVYPSFDAKLRADIYEESILFFHDLFQHDEPVTNILNADYTYLNESLAKHYAIPGVSGAQWRKVDGVKKFGRGGILALASVQSKQAGAARTSAILRGNWVLETLLGEKLPRPPPDIPKLPDEEGADANLTMRQLVQKHTQVESCAVCHQRIDPIGFSFERYDSIGRLRDKESTGLPIDCHAKLKDGTEFEGLDGLRNYLLTKKKDVIVRLFCRRLLGYALGREVILSDRLLLDQMVAAMNKNDGHISAAILEIVRSRQFREIRGSDVVEEVQ